MYGLDTRFRFFDRLNIAGYLLQSETPGKEGKDQARQIEAGWTDNDLSFGVLHHEVGENFNPEVGFHSTTEHREDIGELFLAT